MKQTLTLLALLTSASLGAAISLDLQPTGGTTAAGFLAFEHTTATVFSGSGTGYAAFGGTMTLIVSGSNLENVPADHRAIARNGLASDVNNDWLGVDARNATNVGQTSYFTMTISGLPAGEYTWTSVHHDGGLNTTGAGQGNITGTIVTRFIDATGTVDGTSRISAQNPASGGGPEAPSVFTRGFTSDGTNPVSLRLGSTGIGTDAIFALTSQITIADAIPEPSSALLSGIALFGLLRRRR